MNVENLTRQLKKLILIQEHFVYLILTFWLNAIIFLVLIVKIAFIWFCLEVYFTCFCKLSILPLRLIVILGTKLTFIDPCVSYKCGENEICVPAGGEQATCVCQACDAKAYTPVCGSNGRTYASHCHLKNYACKNYKGIDIVKKASCGKSQMKPIQLVRFDQKHLIYKI